MTYLWRWVDVWRVVLSQKNTSKWMPYRSQTQTVQWLSAQHQEVLRTFYSTLARELVDAILFPACCPGVSAASQTFTLTAASYLHWTSTSLHSICFINSFLFFFSPRGFLRSTAQPHQSTARPLERAPNHIQVTRPSSLFIPVAVIGKCKQINNSNLLYVSDVWENCAISLMLCSYLSIMILIYHPCLFLILSWCLTF